MQTVFKNLLIIFLLFSCSKPDLLVFEKKGVYKEDLKGKWVIYNYWADWCPPCIKEIPELNNLQSNFPEKLKVFLINFDMLDGDDLSQQLKKFNVQVTDPSSIYNWIIPENLPVTFVVNREGNLEHTLVGPQTEKEIINLLSL